MANAKTSLFPLPQTQVVETVYVMLDNGTLVPRSPAELAQLPASQQPAIVIPSRS